MPKLVRPPYVLCHPGDTSGCGFHRVMRPLEIMSRNGVISGRAELQFMQDQQVVALNPDAVIWQRQNEEGQIEVMKNYRRLLPNAFFVYEIDDALSAVPDKSWHKPYMPSGVDNSTAKAIAVCDVVTVTTTDLAKRIKELCGPESNVKIRVVPNMLGKDDLDRVDAQKRLNPKVARTKTRIGWGGGIGHSGDLGLLNQVFIELKDEVEWVFLGSHPEMPEGVKCDFRGATEPAKYLQGLASLDLDLMIAPLERNLFNDCKSNLRLIEGGACRYPIIASDVPTYHTDNPPVFGYVNTPEEWIAKIREFRALGLDKQTFEGEKMRRWVERIYIMDDHAEARCAAWLPDGVRPFSPKFHGGAGIGKPIIIYDGPLHDEMVACGTVVKTLAEAAAVTGSRDVVHIRKTAHITADHLQRALEIASVHSPQSAKVATVSVLSNDGGMLGFPKQNHFVVIDPEAGGNIDNICKNTNDVASIAACCGPLVIMRREALERIGWPQLDAESIDLSIIEWSVCAGAAGFRNIGTSSVYVKVDGALIFPTDKVNVVGNRIGLRWPQQKSDEAAIAKIREKLEITYYRDLYTFLPPQDFTNYPVWVDTMDTPGPRTIDAMWRWVADQELRLALIKYDPMLPVAEVVKAEDLESSEWMLFAPHDATISKEASAIIMAAINDNPQALVIYGDHDYLNEKGLRAGHDFKPNFDLHGFFGRDYVTPICAIRRDKLDPATGMTPAFFGAWLYEQVMNIVRVEGRDKIQHVPYILASLALPKTDELNILTQQKVEVANHALFDMGWDAKVEAHPIGLGMMTISYMGRQDVPAPLVSIIIPTKNKIRMLEPCINTILKMTKYQNYEIIVVDNNTTDAEHLLYLDRLPTVDPRIQVIQWPHDYNWSKLNNEMVSTVSRGDMLCFLNDDTRVISPEWLHEMVGAAQTAGVGAVGAKLIYPHGLIQHIGVVAHRGINGHIHKGVSAQSIGYQGVAIRSHEATAVTGACMLVTRKLFDQVGGFDEELPHNFNDVAFCLDVITKTSLVNVVATKAELQHLEGVTRITARTKEGETILIEEGVQFGKKYKHLPDPYWNPNLQIAAVKDGVYVIGLNMDILNWVKFKRPWTENNGVTKRVLYIGSPQDALPEKRDGISIYEMAVMGYRAQIFQPAMENVGLFDIRDPAAAKITLDAFGIDEVILSSIRNMEPALLPFLTRLGRPVRYRPVDAESACPQHDLAPKGKSCEKTWLAGGCQACIDTNGTSHGFVSHVAWYMEWKRFFENPVVTLDFSELPPEFEEIVSGVYGNGGTEDVLAA